MNRTTFTMNLKFLIKYFLIFSCFLTFAPKDHTPPRSVTRKKPSAPDEKTTTLPRVPSAFSLGSSTSSSEGYTASRPGVTTAFTIAEEKRVRAEALKQAKLEQKRLRRENTKRISESAHEAFDDFKPHERLDINEFLAEPQSTYQKIIATHRDLHEQIASTDISKKQREMLLVKIQSQRDSLIDLHRKQLLEGLTRRARIGGIIHDGTHRGLLRSGFFSESEVTHEMDQLKLTRIQHDIRAEEARDSRMKGPELSPRIRSAGPRRLTPIPSRTE